MPDQESKPKKSAAERIELLLSTIALHEKELSEDKSGRVQRAMGGFVGLISSGGEKEIASEIEGTLRRKLISFVKEFGIAPLERNPPASPIAFKDCVEPFLPELKDLDKARMKTIIKKAEGKGPPFRGFSDIDGSMGERHSTPRKR